MRVLNIVVLLAGLLLGGAGRCRAATSQGSDSAPCSTAYENRNQIDYGPLKVEFVQGATDILVGSQTQLGVSGACLVLFTEKDHKFVTSGKAGNDGRFELKGVVPGRYRLVARAEGLCTANIPLDVRKVSGHRKGHIVIHFRPAGIDTCSSAELVSVDTKRAQTKY